MNITLNAQGSSDYIFLFDSWSSLFVAVSELIAVQVTYVVEYARETVEHFLLAVIIYCFACALLYAAIVRWKFLPFKSDVYCPRRVLVVIAHPDDECMFFGPTILNFTRNPKCTVYLMCLSNGSNYGMGCVRKKELYKSCKVLGVDESCIIIQNHSLLPDSMKAKWPVDLIARLILDHIERYSIDTIITFDKHGVSRHLNHCSIYYAITYLITEGNLPSECKVYVLETINMLRHYWLILDLPICYLLSRHRYILNALDTSIIRKAMHQHRSQLVWFRRLYLIFSRYVIINTLQEVNLSDLELDLELDD